VAKPDTSPLRVHGAILVDDAQRELDEARRTFRRDYDRGHALSERGLWKQGEEHRRRRRRQAPPCGRALRSRQRPLTGRNPRRSEAGPYAALRAQPPLGAWLL
jgi:hypothetical protein